MRTEFVVPLIDGERLTCETIDELAGRCPKTRSNKMIMRT